MKKPVENYTPEAQERLDFEETYMNGRWMDYSTFLSIVEDIFKSSGWVKDISPARFLAGWKAFVDQCRAGYSFGEEEYENDIRVREWIELILSEPRLQGSSLLAEFRLNVEEIDAFYKSLLQPEVALPNKEYWWERGVLSSAGWDYADAILQWYGVHVKVV